MFAWQFSKALHASELRCWTKFVSMQDHYNLINREEEREMLPLCQADGVGVLPWSPLARGRLAREWQPGPATRREETDEFGKTLYTATVESDRPVIDRVGQIASAHGVPRAQVALAWLLHKPVVTSPIIGATKLEHLDDAVGALSVKLSDEDVTVLEAPYVPHPVVGFR